MRSDINLCYSKVMPVFKHLKKKKKLLLSPFLASSLLERSEHRRSPDSSEISGNLGLTGMAEPSKSTDILCMSKLRLGREAEYFCKVTLLDG